jgi:ribosomal protein L37AE/L43A
MTRAPGDHHTASLGQKTMTHTIQCPECGVVLNVPHEAAGRKLKCPKCATKFSTPTFGPADSAIAEPSPNSTMFPTRKGPPSSGDLDLPPRAGSSGSIELPTSTPKKPRKTSDFDLPTASPKKKAASPGDFDLPTTLGDTYELPLLSDDLPVKGPMKGAAPVDALALFQDEPKTNRKLKGAEARAKARRCPSCGAVVGVGMSLCNTCGLDLDTGQRIAPLDVFDDDMPVAPRAEVPPLGVLFVGTFTVLVNVMLAIVSLVASSSQGSGMLCLLVVWIFGIYASVQFLRRKSIRPLFLALGLIAAIGSVYLIALPIIDANVGTSAPPVSSDPDAPLVANLATQLNMNRIAWGIALLLGYAALSVYLNSPTVKREFTKK